MKHAAFEFIFDSVHEAKIVADSLSPEMNHKIPKIEVEVILLENKISLKIKSPEISSLRAACNSYLRWINTAINVKSLVYNFDRFFSTGTNRNK